MFDGVDGVLRDSRVYLECGISAKGVRENKVEFGFEFRFFRFMGFMVVSDVYS